MEDMNNEIICTEAMEDVVEAIPAEGNGLKNIVKVGGIATCAILAWEYAVKPIVRKVKQTVIDKRTTKKLEKAKEIDPGDVNLDDIPEID